MNRCSALTIKGERGSDSDRESVMWSEAPGRASGSGRSSDGEFGPSRKKRRGLKYLSEHDFRGEEILNLSGTLVR